MIFISGAITGTEDYEKRFREAEVRLIKKYDEPVVNPVYIGQQVEQKIENPTRVDYMRPCLKRLLDCDTIYMLKGWTSSKGANAEVNLALVLEMNILFEED